jgi:hypothetical protein
VRAKAIAAILAATVVLVVLVPTSGASAGKPHRVSEPASVFAELNGRGTHGFRFVLFSLGSRAVFLSVSRRVSRVGEEDVNYFGRPRGGRADFGAGTLDVRIGRLGDFHGRFVPTSTETQKTRNGCTGEPTTTEKGFFVGSFDFRGERGYTTVHKHRERGTVMRQGATRCRIPAGHRHHRPSSQSKREREREENNFRLVAGDAEGDIVLQAGREEAPKELHISPTNFQVSALGAKVGNFEVGRGASVFDLERDAAATFQIPNLAEPLSEATITPPAPFSGSATFHLEDPRTATWTGDLAVELPGLGKLPLTGEGIDAGVCKGRSNCTETLPPALEPLLEVGGGFGGLVTVGVKAPSS